MYAYESLIDELIKDGYLKTSGIIEAFKKIDRKFFVPAKFQDRAYVNEALPIGEEQTISQPLVVAFMTELLMVRPGEKILEVGSGSGWQTAILAELVTGRDAHGKIISIERIPDLYASAREHCEQYGFMEKGVIQFFNGDGSRGYGQEAPYDKIIAAASGDVIPEAWKEQVRIGGRIVAPIKNSIVVLDKTAKDTFEQKEYFGFSFVPLIVGQ
ncbi:MAG: protein-L-isoaspartate(D-aspartate) O-methyltransferase [bacterium]|nr:protein-L-isoaspartate(D-aspartate) O-methyltransferase [bacterium]